jgi:hypothetical protein
LTSANAAVVVLDSLSPVPLDIGSSGSFAHFTSIADAGQLSGDGQVIPFTVNTFSSIAMAATTIDLLDLIGIDNFGVKIIRSTSGLFDTFDVLATGSGSLVTLNSSALTNGSTYGFLFNGAVSGTNGGVYAGTYSVAAVPLPPAIWLFLSALIGLVGVVRSRRKSSDEMRTGDDVATAV